MSRALDRLAEASERATRKLARWINKHYILTTIVFTLLTAVSVYIVPMLELKADFIDLLPDHFQSVKDVRKVMDRVGGLGGLDIAIESSNVKASERLADDVVAMLKRDFADRIVYVDYKIDKVKDFYKNNAALYMDLEDLETIRDRVDRKVRAEKLKNNPLFVDLTGDTEKETKLDLKDIEDKYKGDKESYDKYIDGYYTGEGGKLLAILVKTKQTATNMDASRRLIKEISEKIDKLNPASYSPDMKYSFGGSIKNAIEEYDTLKNDIASTGLLCNFLVCLVLFIFFRRIRAVILIGIACMASVSWTFAIAYFAIGYLNTVTAFIWAIIIGNGSNFAVIMLARYFEERRQGRNPEESLEIAMPNTIIATFAASVTTAVAFAVFLVAEVKSFSQFGFIGSIGIMIIWIAAYTYLPAMVILSEKIWSSIEKGSQRLFSDRFNFGFLTWSIRYPRATLSVFVLLAAFALTTFAMFLPNSLEYDMSKLRTKSSEESSTAKLNERVSRIFDVSMTPAVLLAGSPERSREICKALEKKKKDMGDASGIERCRSIFSFLPKDQGEKMEIVRELRRTLNDSSLGFLTDEQKRQVEDVKKSLPQRTLKITDIPEELTRAFKDKDGTLGVLVLVDPRAGRDLWDSTNLYRFTDDIREFKIESGETVTASGDSVIFADLLRLMKKESPITTAGAFLAVFLTVVISFGSFRASIFVTASLLIGTSIMVGLEALLKIKLNFFNFVALPMVFGIGVDYSINLYQRYVQEGLGSIDKVMRRTGTAVILCSSTTVIGYFCLIIADSKALVSLGSLAILGEFSCLSTALIALPAMITLSELGKAKKAASASGGNVGGKKA